MKIPFECPVCKGVNSLRDPQNGEIVVCGGCSSELVVTESGLEECCPDHTAS
jgi:uncharacterized CHY-type Zn-finger protein